MSLNTKNVKLEDISYENMITLYENNGYEYIENDNKFSYSDGTFNIEYYAPWVKQTNVYNLKECKKILKIYNDNTTFEHTVWDSLHNKELIQTIINILNEYGMVFDEGDQKYYYIENNTYIFGVDVDYLIATYIKLNSDTNTPMSYIDILNTMKDDVKNEKNI